jgi:hypothetical protein
MGGRLEAHRRVGEVGIRLRKEQRATHRVKDQQKQRDQAEKGHFVAAEAAPEQLPQGEGRGFLFGIW